MCWPRERQKKGEEKGKFEQLLTGVGFGERGI